MNIERFMSHHPVLKVLSVLFISVIIFASFAFGIINLSGINPSRELYAFIGVIITALSGMITAFINSNKSYEERINRSETKITDAINSRFGKIETDIFQKQTETNRILTDNLTSSLADIKTDIRDLKSDVCQVKTVLEEMTSIKEKREMWRNEINKDWMGSKKRIENINNGILLSVASIVKDNVFGFFEDVIDIDDLSHCDEISVKEKTLANIYDMLESRLVKTQTQLNNLSDDDLENKFIESFKANASPIIFTYKENIEKVFVKNTINSVYRNFYNYSSTFLNELLNMAVNLYQNRLR